MGLFCLQEFLDDALQEGRALAELRYADFHVLTVLKILFLIVVQEPEVLAGILPNRKELSAFGDDGDPSPESAAAVRMELNLLLLDRLVHAIREEPVATTTRADATDIGIVVLNGEVGLDLTIEGDVVGAGSVIGLVMHDQPVGPAPDSLLLTVAILLSGSPGHPADLKAEALQNLLSLLEAGVHAGVAGDLVGHTLHSENIHAV